MIDDGRSLAAALPEATEAIEDERDRAFVQACVYAALRHHFALDGELTARLRRPLKRRDADLRALMLAGLAQLRHMDVPAHAAVSASVEAARALGKDWACGLVNGVLRAALREGPPPGPSDMVRWEHPAWLIDATRTAWPDAWEAILEANNEHAPMTLRVNALRSTREDYLERLRDAGLDGEPTSHAVTGLRLARPVPTGRLPGFDTGKVSVQDEAAQLAAPLLAPEPGERVLDACAAPGGKTAHLIEQAAGDLALTAIDASSGRLADVSSNLARLGIDCLLRTGDAGDPASWSDGRPYDRILLDAPCSATGVIRRHPDIRLHRRPADLAALAETQRRLIAALWPLLRRGGRLLYATCSIMPEENDAVVADLLHTSPDATIVPLNAASWGRATEHGRQILPGEDQMDGFYFALLEKAPPG